MDLVKKIDQQITAPSEYATAFKAELYKRYTEYKNGSSKTLTSAESKKRIKEILKSGDISTNFNS